jgi:hypothetical protein
MKKYYNLAQKIKSYIKSFLFFLKYKNDNSNHNLKLNLGCGNAYRDGWINIDIDSSKRTDICCDFINLKNHFNPATIDSIYMIHSICYLNLWESMLFFKDAYNLLKAGGILELEFPDIEKCSKIITDNIDYENYLEGVRGIYAFDLNQIQNNESYRPYAFGWTGKYMRNALLEIGFTEISILDPETHGKRTWRDTRIIAIK